MPGVLGSIPGIGKKTFGFESHKWPTALIMSDNDVSSSSECSSIDSNDSSQSSHPDQRRVKLLINSELLSDVSFSVGQKGTVVYGHRFPLAATSDVFYRMFTEPNANSGQTLEVPDVEPAIFLEMLQFIYCGHLTLSEENLVDMYYAADKYDLGGLKKRCQLYIQEEESAVMKIFTTNLNHGFEELNETCLVTICRNPLFMFRSSDFVDLPLELVEKVVARNELRCNDDQLLGALKKWCNHQPPTTINVRETFKRLSDIVRKRREQWQDYHCRKWFYFGQICYTADSCGGVYNLTALKDLELYGVGMYIGCRGKDQPMSISVTVKANEKPIRKFEAKVLTKEDIYIYDCMLERLSLSVGSNVSIHCEGPKGVQGNKPAKLTFYRRWSTWTGDSTVLQLEDDRNNQYQYTAIAHIYYQVKKSDEESA
ncbi:uncharacterized protein LOC129739908 [Uranotaenia lowii]|uniref:uncharacterized protein LOC129739908 n=1 Tax=Uranotaenia lowii TaxID=190385 RepID=UPI002478D338|nr:uncharacterized protein LOC129739908 [Uranotaenia lowii]